MTDSKNQWNAKKKFQSDKGEYVAYSLKALEEAGLGEIDKLPYSIKVLLESCLRNLDGHTVTEEHVKALAGYNAKDVGEQEVPFSPGRVVLQDFTGVPAVVDLAACRSAMDRWGKDTSNVNPLSRVDLVIDHSVQVDEFGKPQAIKINSEMEFKRNQERYEFLKWGKQAFSNFSVVPPETGIVHQVNLEYLAKGVLTEERDGEQVAFPDSLVGTDSHTTMINGLGVTGWGVGGIEAEACMLGQPIFMLIPEVVGFELTGELKEGTTATDLVLTVTQMLRKHGVVGKFVEFHGPGLASLTLADRATIANMAPEYGATMGYFPIDQKTLDYLHLTGRDEDQIDLVEKYTKENGFWRDDNYDIEYSSSLKLDLGDVEPSLAGPKNPHERVIMSEMQGDFRMHCEKTFNKPEKTTAKDVEFRGNTFDLTDGDIVIAAITSCTNTSNPAVMMAAGLVARKAKALGLKAKPWVKTSLAPGSRVVTKYLDDADLTKDLEDVGFFTVGYGCTTCIGNSGPLPEPIEKAIIDEDLVACSVLSGNRNFEGRVSPYTKGNYLASPPLVVAYAIAGTTDIDMYNDPIGQDQDGNDVFLKDIWPSNEEVREAINQFVSRDDFTEKYAEVYEGPEEWQKLDAPTGQTFAWSDESTYIQEPPFFVDMGLDVPEIEPVKGARCLAKVGDNTTTDHISPAGVIPTDSPAGRYLIGKGVEPKMFNSYGSRRGNDQVMTRGTFGNVRLKNQLAPGTEGGYTTYLGPDEEAENPPKLNYTSDYSPSNGEQCFIYDAAVKYMQHRIPTVVLGGINYGMGSSRDWAAKGTFLQGVKAVIAKSYERIHRSNLIGMGVLPLQFQDGDTHESLGLTGHEIYDIDVDDNLEPMSEVWVTATDPETGDKKEFSVDCRIDTPAELDYYRNGGILHMVLRRMGNEA
ncbi:aconitate hydratase AcnA [Persicimonas caeni]|uniref:Aconitate hydratase n=1 Tax=Persicimonas caeni TaxID=2292766 RepID=A0A4Y6PQT5_PERCE|nr:aconitate hydratase AcnA [Persicimonas caeni]QDG50691.1 aconitate hydratase AcnA [Persicimonas caeni]QED31912.1 aconitate hydratase AcnA [Persicimonas caeni]